LCVLVRQYVQACVCSVVCVMCVVLCVLVRQYVQACVCSVVCVVCGVVCVGASVRASVCL